jgi:hypothetical protein
MAPHVTHRAPRSAARWRPRCCGRTHLVNEAQEDLAHFREMKAPGGRRLMDCWTPRRLLSVPCAWIQDRNRGSGETPVMVVRAPLVAAPAKERPQRSGDILKPSHYRASNSIGILTHER